MKQIIIDDSGKISRTALLEEGKLVEIIVDDASDESLVGNIYAGLVKSILPSQFAFVDIGLAKNAFVYLSDNREVGLYKNGKLTIKPGKTLLVQVLKDPAGTKGAYVTSRLSFTGRYLVVADGQGANMPVGISKKIEDSDERDRLKSIFRNLGNEVIVRTNAADVEQDILLSEYNESVGNFKKIEQWQNVRPPALLHKEADGLRKAVQDLHSADVEEIVVNTTSAYEQVVSFLSNVSGANTAMKLYDGEIPIFDMYAIERQIEKAMNKRVWLKSGGFIVIERTEACMVIDVNSGKFSGKKNHEETMLQVNIEAAGAIAEQLRLRNLSGIIIIDFIDMKDPKNIKLLTDYLIEQTKKDRISVSVIGMTELGLMQLTRKKNRKPMV